MNYYILITLCVIVLIAYLFEVTGKFSKIPAVIFLMLLGMALKPLMSYFGIQIPNLSILLPLMGTLGLILIVMEGSLDLKISYDRKALIINSLMAATLLFVLFVASFSLVLVYVLKVPVKTALINSIPLGIISSAVAIPSSMGLRRGDREFIVYESSMSDIVGILIFNFALFNNFSIGSGLIVFFVEVIISVIVSIAISAALAYLLNNINHHVKYVIILTFVVLIYVLANLIHWPSLIVVLIFGLIMNNLHLSKKIKISKKLRFEDFEYNLKSFKQITGELTFLIRSFFFLIFGYYTSVKDLLNLDNLFFSTVICGIIFLLRALFFRGVLKKSLTPLLYFAPRGLITILLFLSIPDGLRLSFINEGVITQVIFITIILMTIGNILKPSLQRID